jgi:hypothetical protein
MLLVSGSASMDEKTRQLVLDMLAKAHATALKSVQTKLGKLPETENGTALRFMGEFRACLLDLFGNALSPEETQERISALIYGHPDPLVVQVLKEYAEAVHYLLVESRNGLLSPKKPKGH